MTVSVTYPPEQILLGGGVEDFGYLQVGVHTEAMLRGARSGRPSRGAVLFVSLRSGLRVRVLRQLWTGEEIQMCFFTSRTASSRNAETTRSAAAVTSQTFDRQFAARSV